MSGHKVTKHHAQNTYIHFFKNFIYQFYVFTPILYLTDKNFKIHMLKYFKTVYIPSQPNKFSIAYNICIISLELYDSKPTHPHTMYMLPQVIDVLRDDNNGAARV